MPRPDLDAVLRRAPLGRKARADIEALVARIRELEERIAQARVIVDEANPFFTNEHELVARIRHALAGGE